MHTLNDTARFLQAIFPNYLTSAIFANLNPPAHKRDYTKLDTARDCYWSIAAFPAGVTSNLGDLALDVRALVIDDVGTKGPSAGAVVLALNEPTTIVETSPGNFQYGYRLSKPVAKADWPGFLSGIDAMLAHGKPLEARGPQTLMRLPMGVNTKPHNNGFRVRLVTVNADRDLDPDTIPRIKSKATGPLPCTGGAVDKYDRETLRALMALIPVNHQKLIDNRDLWADVGHWIKALCDTPENGWEIFNEWSAGWEGNGRHDYTEEYTWDKWDGFGRNGGLQCTGGNLRALAEEIDREGFRVWDAKRVFDPGPNDPFPDRGARKGITATPYQWVDPDKLPPRDWLYGNILIRQFISMTVAPGGVGKSSLTIVEALAMVTGRNLLGEKPAGKLRVWLWNLEDPLEETQRRIQAACLHYGVTEADIGGRLFVDSGRDQRLVIAQMNRNSGPMVVKPVVADLVEQIKTLEIDVTVIDPFVSCHEVPENDNTAQDMVVKEWGQVSGAGRCAVHLIDHTRKAPSGTEVTTESSRGGKAKTDAARVVRVVNRMTANQGETFEVQNPWLYFNTFNDKANMAPPVDQRDWFFMDSVSLGNGGGAAEAFSDGASVGAGVIVGDSVGVVTRWTPPSVQDLVTGANFKAMSAAMAGKQWREDIRSKEKWIGIAAGEALNLDPENEKERKAIKEVLKTWLKTGLLKKVEHDDERRRPKIFIEIAGGF